MAWAGVISGLLGALGSIGGGLLSSQGSADKPGSQRNPLFDPYLSPGLQAQQIDALTQLGYGNIYNAVSPLEELYGRINSLPLEEKDKRRALKYIGNQYLLHTGQETFDDPYSRGLGGRKVFNIEKTADWGVGRFGRIASRLGMSESDLADIFEQDAAFKVQQKKLADAGLTGLNVDTILNRAQAARSASQLLGDAGRFATGGPMSEGQSSILDSINRNIADQRERLMLQAQFGGFNPSAGLESLDRLQQDSEQTALAQSVASAAAIINGLNAGNQNAQSSVGLNVNAGLNSLGLASQQALASNQLAAQMGQNRYDSLANGLSSGASGLGNSILLSQIIGQKSPTVQSSGGGGSGNGSSEWDWG